MHKEINGLQNPNEYHAVKRDKRVYWDAEGLVITRLRLLSDPGFPVWDVSYCHGFLPDGTFVEVELPFTQLSKGKRVSEIIAWSKLEKVSYKKLRILENTSTLC